MKARSRIGLLGFELICLMKTTWKINPSNIVMHVFLLSVEFRISLPGEDQVGDYLIQALNMHIPVKC